MEPAAAPWAVLLDTMGIAEPCADDTAMAATACTGKEGRVVRFWFKKANLADIALLQLHVSNLLLETPNTTSYYYYGGGGGGGGYAVSYFPEVVCTHKGLVLIRLSSPHTEYPTEYFVYGCHAIGQLNQGQPWVVRLPKIVPEIHSCNSIGVLRADDARYVVANLRFQVNPQTWKVHVFLDCYSSWQMVWSQTEVTPVFPDEDHMCEWQTDLVIPSGDSQFLWVDLLRGILLCPNLLAPERKKSLNYVPLPSELLSPRPEDVSRGRPQQLRNLACINGDLKLVDLHITNDNSLELAIWTLQGDTRSWKKERRLNHPKATLVPSFPVLSTDESDILYLTVAQENKARLLKIDMKTWTIIDSKGYPRFFNHRNPPYPSELSKYLHNCSNIENHPTPAKYPRICTIGQNSTGGDCTPVSCAVQKSLFPSCASSSEQWDTGAGVLKCLDRPLQIPALQPSYGKHALSSQVSEHHPLDLSTLLMGIQSPQMGHGRFSLPFQNEPLGLLPFTGAGEAQTVNPYGLHSNPWMILCTMFIAYIHHRLRGQK